jgi:hypothetical protein
VSVTFEIKLSDAMYAALVHKARTDGQAVGNQTGRQVVTRKALKAYLNQNGYKSTHLEMTDAEYHEWVNNRSGGVPEARNPQNRAAGANR